MKKLIRKGVFETNSSSSHSIAIASEDKEFVLDTIYPDQHGTIIVRGDEFGWDWFKHNDAETKASYAAQQFTHDSNALETLEYVIKEQTGAKRVIFKGLNDGYVDHESYGIVGKSAYELKNFIFNKNSWLFGGNDNSEADPTFYHVPEIREGKVILPEYKYELVIEGVNKTTKYLTYPTQEELRAGIESLIGDEMFYNSGQPSGMGNNIMWQVTRQRNMFQLGYRYQDYSNNEIVLYNESFNDYQFEKQIEDKLVGMDYDQKQKFVSEEIKKLDGITLIKKFELKEI